MVASQNDPFASNPYVAPEMYEGVEVSHPSPTLHSCWRWLATAVVVEAAMTLTMVTLHSSSPRVNGLNVYALANLFLSGVLAVSFGWFVGSQLLRPRAILVAQLLNLLIWLTFTSVIHIWFGIRFSSEGSLLLISGAVSSVMVLIASLISSRTPGPRSVES